MAESTTPYSSQTRKEDRKTLQGYENAAHPQLTTSIVSIALSQHKPTDRMTIISAGSGGIGRRSQEVVCRAHHAFTGSDRCGWIRMRVKNFETAGSQVPLRRFNQFVAVGMLLDQRGMAQSILSRVHFAQDKLQFPSATASSSSAASIRSGQK